MSTLFKFSKPPDGLTRIVFMDSPSWAELSTKLESYYDIPRDHVGVSYVDPDGDEVTLSSDEELQDYYKLSAPMASPGQSRERPRTIRFTVRDLSAMHIDDSENPLLQTPQGTNHRNTFGLSGLPTGVLDGDDWQHIAPFANAPHNLFAPLMGGGSPAPHAFLEAVESEVNMSRADDNDDASSVTQSDYETSKVDKGKGRASVESDHEEDAASAAAMIEEDIPDKHPVHVRDASFERAGADDPPDARMDIEVMAPTPTASTVTPVARVHSPEAPDPPLPDLGTSESRPAPGTSLANDVAGLINTFSSVFAAHPELTEGMRNIVRNASTGVYWQAHREAVAKAAAEVRRGAAEGAEDIRRAAEQAHRAAEEAAGHRVADAIGSVVRALGHFAGVAPPDVAAAAANTASEPVTSTPVNPAPETPTARRPNAFRRDTWHFSHHDTPTDRASNRKSWAFGTRDDPFASSGGPANPFFRPGGMFPPAPPPPPPPHMPPPHFHPPSMHHIQVPPPPPMYQIPQPPMPPFPPMMGPSVHPHPPPTPPVNMPGGWGAFGPVPTQDTDAGLSTPTTTTTLPPGMIIPPGFSTAFPELAGHGMPPPTVPAPSQSQPQEGDKYKATKESLQAAKDRYRAEREKYRKERDAKKSERMRQLNSSNDSTQPSGDDAPKADDKDQTPTQSDHGPSSSAPPRPPMDPKLVSNARGAYPRLELESVSPRRHHTIHGTNLYRHTPHHHHSGQPLQPRPPPPPFVPPFPSYNPFTHVPPPPPPPSAAVQPHNVMRRLADMGFTPTNYPGMLAKVTARVQRISVQRLSGAAVREAEDAAVTDVLEELLAQPQAASSQTQVPPSSGDAGTGDASGPKKA